MGKIFEKIVVGFLEICFGNDRHKLETKERKDEYTLSSVFPNPQIMYEVKKHIRK